MSHSIQSPNGYGRLPSALAVGSDTAHSAVEVVTLVKPPRQESRATQDGGVQGTSTRAVRRRFYLLCLLLPSTPLYRPLLLSLQVFFDLILFGSIWWLSRQGTRIRWVRLLLAGLPGSSSCLACNRSTILSFKIPIRDTHVVRAEAVQNQVDNLMP
jgi:hypothetical protein